MAKLSHSNTGSRKNLIINGDMQVSQRGTSFTGLGDGDTGYTLDRWEFYEVGTPVGVVTVTQDTTDVPDAFGSAMKIDCTTAETFTDTSSSMLIRQKFEGYDIQHLLIGDSDAKPVTVSFWLKSDTKTGNMAVYLYTTDGTRLYPTTINVADNNWNRYTIVVPGDTGGTTVPNDSSQAIELVFVLSAGSAQEGATKDTWQTYGSDLVPTGIDNFLDNTANNIWIAGVQLEVGSQATDFEHRSYGEELLLCQRYCFRFDQNRDGICSIGAGTYVTTTTGYLHVQVATPMRVSPTFSYNAVGDFTHLITGADKTCTALSMDQFSHITALMSFTTAATTTGIGTVMQMSNADAFFMFDAEL